MNVGIVPNRTRRYSKLDFIQLRVIIAGLRDGDLVSIVNIKLSGYFRAEYQFVFGDGTCDIQVELGVLGVQEGRVPRAGLV